MAVRTETAAEIRAGRVGPRGRWLRENIEAAPEMATEPAVQAVLPSVFSPVAGSRGRSPSRTTLGSGTIVSIARVTATTSFLV